MVCQVDFYILNQAKHHKAMVSICNLVEKLSVDKKIYMQFENEKAMQEMNDLLWTFKDISFVSHAPVHENKDAVILLSASTTLEVNHCDLLFNLSATIPSFANHFRNIIEIVFSDEILQQQARERYRQYRQMNCHLNTYKNN